MKPKDEEEEDEPIAAASAFLLEEEREVDLVSDEQEPHVAVGAHPHRLRTTTNEHDGTQG
jgi:hypothetical protein